MSVESGSLPEGRKPDGPGELAEWARFSLRTWLRWIILLTFRPRVTGWENLPPNGPFIIVSNHSAGVAFAELLSFAVRFVERFGTERPLAGFAHHVVYRTPLIHPIMRGMGAVPSTYEAAGSTLAAGVPLLVFPGGDHDSLRPFWHVNRVDFLGRKGFLRIAIRSGVPIVPMGITGSHFTCPMLFRSTLYSRLLVLPARLGFKRWGMSLGSVLGCFGIAALPCSPWVQGPLIWLFLVSPLQFIPLVPWKIRFRIGAPMESSEWHEDALEEPYHSVLTAIRNLVR